MMDLEDSNRDDTRRVCGICNKDFSSAKALGGHMRIHFEKVRDKDLVLDKNRKAHPTIELKKQILQGGKRGHGFVENKKITATDGVLGTKGNEKPTCMMCGKSFRSMKSLFGHMKCHPERDRRGTHPLAKSSSSSSSSLSDAEIREFEDHQAQFPATSEGNKPVYLTESFSGWQVTRRRGQRAVGPTDTSKDEQLKEAVDNLMMLAQGSNSSISKAKGLDFDLDFKRPNDVAKTVLGHRSVLGSKLNGHKYSHRVDSATTANVNALIKDGKKRRRKAVKLCDSKLAQKAGPVSPVTATEPPARKYRCNTCAKLFETHRALGGHRSSHNRCKTAIRSPIPKPDHNLFEDIEKMGTSSNQASVNRSLCQAMSPGEARRTSSRMMDIDLNEPAPSDDIEAGSESEFGAGGYDYASLAVR